MIEFSICMRFIFLMNHIKSFNLYSPVLSTDIVNDPQPSPNDNTDLQVTNEQDSQISSNQIINKKKKNKKNKNKNKKKLIQQQQNELLNKINIKIPETQEDIDAWIAERKKKFPTRKRIEEKEQNLQERQERGALDLSDKANKEKRKESKKNFFQTNSYDKSKPIEMSAIRPTKIPSLLDKLTQDETRKKHSIILQCFRYFVNHNFLQDEFDPNVNKNDSSYYSSEYYSDDDDVTVNDNIKCIKTSNNDDDDNSRDTDDDNSRDADDDNSRDSDVNNIDNDDDSRDANVNSNDNEIN